MELTEAVAALAPSEATRTVAFAHLAINKAITQRHVIGSHGVDVCPARSVTHRGLTGPDQFASLARTFTGHFHSYQTITQEQYASKEDNLQGSITYLGSPLQLSWTDLYDEQRGVVLFDPETLEHEQLVNPHAVSYTTADLQQVLCGQVNEGTVAGKHVMLTGKLTRRDYFTARDKLLGMGVRNVRSWTPMGLSLHSDRSVAGGLGASVPASDSTIQLPEEGMTSSETDLHTTTDGDSGFDSASANECKRVGLAAEAREYATSLDLDEDLLLRVDDLVRIGQRIIQASREISDEYDEDKVHYRDFLSESFHVVDTKAKTELVGDSVQVFVAEPTKLTITNFLGVQNTISIDYRKDLQRGLTFLVGDNGSGKSTIIEAMVWCQFGRCIRGGLAVNDVVNDKSGKNCSVKLEFANGYTIERFRKHKVYKNRVIVAFRGEPQHHLEHPDMRTTQAAINELLGTDYETYVRTVVLGHESAASFMNLTPVQRRDLIETTLGLSVLDQCAQLSRLLLKDIDAEMDRVKDKVESLTRKMVNNETRLDGLKRTLSRLEDEAQEAVALLKAGCQDHASAASYSPELTTDIRGEIMALQKSISTEQQNLQRLKNCYVQMQDKKHFRSIPRPGWLQQRLMHELETSPAGQRTGLHGVFKAIEIFVFRFLVVSGKLLQLAFQILKSYHRDTSTTQVHSEEAALVDLQRDIETSSSRLQSLKHEEKLSTERAIVMSEQLAQAVQARESLEILKQQALIKQHEVAIHKRLAEAENSSLHSLRSERDALATKLKETAADRELFFFWSAALAKRSSRVSSSTVPSSTAKTTSNLREHILVKSLSELNTLLAQVLTVLYDDTRHVHMASGMLRSLFEPESADDDDMMDNTTSSSGSVLGPTLAVHPSLAYSKRSSGERKRVNLALFFALLQLARARSAHRAQYVLVDEVFDNLDKAGQAAIVRWCRVMSQTAVVGCVVIITHSQYLVEQDPGEDANRAVIMRAVMGQRGTELSVDERSIGGV